MQVDRYNHLLFPRDANTGSAGNNSAATGKESTSAPVDATGLKARPQPLGWGKQADTRVASRTESVVLKIQWPDGSGSKPADIPLYTPGRRMPAAGDAETGVMARQHQAAVDRQAGGSTTPIAVNKDGVLVTTRTPHPTEQQPDAQPDFVALAVSALREYRDDPERQRLSAAQASAPEAHWSALKGLQQFAAKLNVFA
jgi:hypothetical protein